MATGCISNATVLTVNPVAGAPVITLDNLTDVTCFGDNDGSASILVSGGASPYTYAWSPSGGTNPSATGLIAGNYTVTVTDILSCSSVLNIIIGSPSQISLGVTETDITCGSGGGQVSTNVSGGSGIYSYAWTPNGETSSSIIDLAAGNYGLTVTDGQGCTASGNYSVGTTGSLNLSTSPSSTTIDAGSSVQLNASGATTFSWSPSNTLSCSNCPDPIASPSSTTTYIVIGEDEYGCAASDQVTVIINLNCGEIFVPTVFSPNGDNRNEKLVVCGLAGGCVTEYKFEVFDRWGQSVFISEDITLHWDGQFKDKELNSAVFVYKLYAVKADSTVIETSGNVTLTR
jgi:gliding motility-associated-like protein